MASKNLSILKKTNLARLEESIKNIKFPENCKTVP